MSIALNLPRRTLLASLAAWPLAAWARRHSDAPAVALAMEAPADIDPAGFLVSEKYDGARAVWDGRHLRFRSGLPVAAPAWFLAKLPVDQVLDGELWAGRGRFQALSGAVRRHVPDDAEWRQIRYMVFDLPHSGGDFTRRSAAATALVQQLQWPPAVAVPQAVIASRAALQQRLAMVVAGAGEGLMLQRADAPHRAGRSSALLKLKPLHDAEAVVTGHVPGRGRHAGRLGALRVRAADGTEFLLGTGFNDAEREAPPPAGSTVSYSHRGLTDAGVPRFASFLRVRDGF